MSFNSSGETQYLILDSLAHGSKYGLEIIEFISTKSGGNYILKKPTLYSCLTRMEKKGLVSSSYWGESELGGKRHYYSITDEGKKALEELSQDFADFSFEDKGVDAFKDEETTTSETSPQNDENSSVYLQQDNIFNMLTENKNQESKQTEKQEENNTQTSTISPNQMDFFSFQAEEVANTQNNVDETYDDTSSENESMSNSYETTIFETNQINQTNQTNQINQSEQTTQSKEEYYQSVLEQNIQPPQTFKNEDETSSTTSKDDGKFLDANERLTPAQEEQNRRLYDTSSELKRYRKKKSFSENQIELSVVYEKAEDKEIQKQRIEELKASMLQARQNGFDSTIVLPTNTETNKSENNTNSFDAPLQSSSNTTTFRYFDNQNDGLVYSKEMVNENVSSVEDSASERLDDAVLITSPRIHENEIPIQRKITPPNIDIDVSDENLPAPKRNTSLEPTYKDMMAKLFERKKEKPKAQTLQIPAVQESTNFDDVGSFADYDTLKKYYAGHSIEFKEYNRTNVERHHNTNFLNFISSVALLLLSGIGCAVIFGIISGVKLLSASTNFLFYTVPILFLIYTIFTFIRHKVYPSKKATLVYNSLINWMVFILGAIIVVIANVIAGMQYEIMAQFVTSLVVPIYALLLAFPVNYYIKKFLYKKYAK